MGGSSMASCLILLIHLLLVMFADAAREGFSEIDEKSKEVKLNDDMEERFKEKPIIKMMTQMDEIEQQQQQHAHSSHMNHNMNPLFKVFFTMSDLKQGQKLPFYFPKRDPSKSIPPFLSKEEADEIPFSLKELPQILSHFSFPSNSPQAQVIKETLQACETPPIKGETKLCVTSKESMVDLLATAFGSQSHFKALTTSHLTQSNNGFQNYTFIEAPTKILAPRVVACHTMVYTYAVYYCHYQQGDTNVLKIPLRGENGDLVDALAICHMDTSDWSPSHPAFQALHIQPGTIPVCHFFPAGHVVWMPLPA